MPDTSYGPLTDTERAAILAAYRARNLIPRAVPRPVVAALIGRRLARYDPATRRAVLTAAGKLRGRELADADTTWDRDVVPQVGQVWHHKAYGSARPIIIDGVETDHVWASPPFGGPARRISRRPRGHRAVTGYRLVADEPVSPAAAPGETRHG